MGERHVYIESAAFTQPEIDEFLACLYRGMDKGNKHYDAIAKFRYSLQTHLHNVDPRWVTSFKDFDTDEVARTRNFCICCDERPATEGSAECEICEAREI